MAFSRMRPGLVLGCLLLAGTVIRLPHLTDPPIGFHPTRQYRAAVIARGYALNDLAGFDDAERAAAAQMASNMGPIEPPILEHVGAWLYRLAGREALWMPRLVGVLAWTAGAAALWWLVAPMHGALAAAAAVAVFLFLPYGVPASQAFQPDGLMTALIVAAWAASYHRHRTPGARAVAFQLFVTAAAVFVKPMAVFFIVPVELVLSAARGGALRAIVRTGVWSVAAVVPAVAWYIYVALTAPTVLDDRFFPQLLARFTFWTDWLGMANRVVPWQVLVPALAGVALSRGDTRRGLVAAWLGYLAYGMLFTHHIHTHDYYSLPLIALAAWSLAAAIPAALPRLPEAWRQQSAAALCALLTLAIGVDWWKRPYAPSPDDVAEAIRYERIGRQVGHSTRVVSLDGNYGFALGYHGRLVAANLPLSIDSAVGSLSGRSGPAPEALVAALNGDFFVGTNQAELDGQPALRDYLAQRYSVVDREGSPSQWRHVVYDLRRTGISVLPGDVSTFVRVGSAQAPRVTADLWAASGERWSVRVPEPAVIDVVPAAGEGPARLTVIPRPAASAFDQVVSVPVHREGEPTPSAVLRVRVKAVADGVSKPPFGFVDAPPDPVVLGTAPVLLQGWALDDLSMRRVWVGYVNATGQLVPLGDATLGGHRPDVAAAHPNAHDIYNSAWAFALDAGLLRGQASPVAVVVVAEDGDGLRTELGRRQVTIK